MPERREPPVDGQALLTVEDLCVTFDTPAGALRAVDGVSFELPRGRTLALVGESGCGKSVTALSIMRLISPPGRIAGGRIRLEDTNLLGLSAAEMRAVRGGRVAIIFQEPMTSLNPVLTIGAQIVEAVNVQRHARRKIDRGEPPRDVALRLLKLVGIPDPAARLAEYPHRLSGGMRQRVMIAMALAGEPELLLADEPTTALDVTIQAQVLALLRDLQQQRGLSMLLVTHDLGVVAQVAHHVCVMYAGRVVEQISAERLFAESCHPYTRALLRSLPRLNDTTSSARGRLATIPGEIPNPLNRPSGCAFFPRCTHARRGERCAAAQQLLPIAPGHTCACWAAGLPA